MYKTIVLALLEEHPEIHGNLRKHRKLLTTLNLYAEELKANHETWKEYLSKAKPETDESQIAAAALELAVKELMDYLTSGVPSQESEAISLDGAMAFIRGREPLE